MSSSPASIRTLLRLAAPMILARASQAVITFSDTIQVKHLGLQAIAAVSTGGLNVMGIEILAMGTVFIIQSFVSQLTGRGDRDQAPRFAWYGLAIALVTGLAGAAMGPLIHPVLAHLPYSPEVRGLMASYMSIRLLSVGAAAGTEALGNWFGGLGNTWMQMIAGLVTMTTAVVLNWILIDGRYGAPAMGVDGAAVASVVATFLGFAVLLVAFWFRLGGAPRARATGLSLRELRRVVRFGLPSGLNWFLEFAAFQLFVNGVLASLGDTVVAALNVVISVNAIAFMPAFGLASAGAILAGQAIGRGDRSAVWPQVKITLACTMTWMGAVGSVYALFPGEVLELFKSQRSGELVAIGSTMLVISAAWQLSDAIGITLSETLRAAGDTAWTAGARLLLAWLVFTPSAFLVVLHFGGGSVGAMLCLVGYLILLATALGWRFRSGAWKRIELIEPRLV